jgi:hypothetical protein
MAKTFPISLEVEEIALGSVLRRLNEMPGIAKLNLNLGKGGEGAGKEKLAKVAARQGESAEQGVLRLLMNGPMHISEIATQLGGTKARAYGATHQLRKKGLVEAGEHKGFHRLSKKVAQLSSQAKLALPAPPIKRGAGGRAAPGSGSIVLRTFLNDGPKSPSEVRSALAAQGLSAKSASGILERAKKSGLIKKNGSGYELTAKGQKIELGAEHHG